jgi:hypothetical protein
MIEILGESALRSLVLASGVWLALRLLRIRNLQAETTAWIVVLAAALAMPLLMQAKLFDLPAVPHLVPQGLRLIGPTMPTPTVPPVPPQVPAPPGAGNGWPVLALGYGAVTAVLLVRLLVGLAASWRIVRRAQRIDVSWARGLDVRVSGEVTAPMTVGCVVLLPATVTGWPAAKRRAVIRHERCHVEHHDFAVQCLNNLHAALFWFSPLSGWLQRRLAFLAELTSDEAAVAAVGDRIDYAEILLDIAVDVRRGLPAGVAMARPAMLRQRVERILSGVRPAIRLAPRSRVLLALCLVPVVLIAAGAGWYDRASALPSIPAAPTTRGLPARSGARPATVDGPDFVILRGGHMTVSIHNGGSRLLDARDKVGGDAILFLHRGEVYAIADLAQINDALAAYGRQSEISRRRDELGERQAALAVRLAELGRRHGELGSRRAEISARRKERSGDAEGDVETAIELAHESAELSREEGELGGEEGRLAGEQAGLAAEQQVLSEEESRVAYAGDLKVRALIERALRDGAAMPLP